MALIRCSSCGRASLYTEEHKCQFCGKTLKLSIWARKLRRKEAYGFLLVFTGALVLGLLKAIGILVLLLGMTMIATSVLRQRKPRIHTTAESVEHERIIVPDV